MLAVQRERRVVAGKGFGEVVGGQITEGLHKGFGLYSKCAGKLLGDWEQARARVCLCFAKITPVAAWRPD